MIDSEILHNRKDLASQSDDGQWTVFNFLEELARRPLNQSADGLVPYGVFIGPGQLGLEVAVYASATKPN